MTLLSHIQLLPKAGANFKARTHLGSFEDKLTKMIRESGYHGLNAVKDDVVGAMRKFEGKIRTGGIRELQAQQAYKKIVIGAPDLNSTTKKHIRDIFEYYTEGKGASHKLAEAQRRIAESKIQHFEENEAMDKTVKAVSVSQIAGRQSPGRTISSLNAGSLRPPAAPVAGSGFRPTIPLSR